MLSSAWILWNEKPLIRLSGDLRMSGLIPHAREKLMKNAYMIKTSG